MYLNLMKIAKENLITLFMKCNNFYQVVLNLYHLKNKFYSIPRKVGALRFSLKRYSKLHFAVSSSAGC